MKNKCMFVVWYSVLLAANTMTVFVPVPAALLSPPIFAEEKKRAISEVDLCNRETIAFVPYAGIIKRGK